MRVVVIIQARMASRRLPGKVLAEIEGKPMLWYVIQRVKAAMRIDDVMVATPDTVEDVAIHQACFEWHVPCWSIGCHPNDVLTRYKHVALMAERGADIIVRITADCPLIDPYVIDRTVEHLLQSRLHFATNVSPRSFPDGLDVEAMTWQGLLELDARSDGWDREHVTPLIYRPGAMVPIARVRHPEDLSALRWTVDTEEDLAFVREVYRRFAPRWDFFWWEVLNLGEFAQRKAVA